MISCVRSLVCVIQHAICGGCIARVPTKLITGAGSSPGCAFQPREVHGAPVEPRRRAGLQAAGGQRQFAQAGAKRFRRRVARAPGFELLQPDVDQSGQERSRRQHDRVGLEGHAHLRDHAGYAGAGAAVVDREVVDRLLEQREVRLVLEPAADRGLVEDPVRLRARRPHGRPLARIERAKLDPGFVRRDRHRAAERVDLLDEMPFADAADRRVARHLPERLDVVRQQERPAAHPRAGERSLGPGVAAADHNDLVSGSEYHDYIDILFTFGSKAALATGA